MRIAPLLLALLATAVQAAPARLSEAEARSFVERQSKAWNAGELTAYFALFTPDATFTDQARAKDGRVVPYGTSTLAQARVQTRKSLAKARSQEAAAVRAVKLAPDGRAAEVSVGVVTTLTAAGRVRRLCAERLMRLVATPAGPRSKGQTDTLVACR